MALFYHAPLTFRLHLFYYIDKLFKKMVSINDRLLSNAYHFVLFIRITLIQNKPIN